MGISASTGETIVEFKANSVLGGPAIAGHTLKFPLNYIMPPWKNKLSFRNTIAKVYIGKDKMFLGRAFPELPATFQSTDHQQSGCLIYEMTLTKEALEEIEKIRSGGDLDFTIELCGEYKDNHNQLCTYDKISYKANQKEWIETLKTMNFKGGLVFELPMNIKPSAEIETALKAIEKAREHLYYGNYDEVVAKCRISLETIFSEWRSIGLTKLDYNNRKEMTKSQRFINAANQIMHFTHLAHHPDSNSNLVTFTRAEAVFVLGSTISIVSSYSESNSCHPAELKV